MKQIMLIKSKRKVNRTKRAKVGSHGLKVFKNTYVYIAKETEPSSWGGARGGKPAPRKEIVERFTELFNHEKSIRKMVKHIKGVSIKYSTNPRRGGSWNYEKQWVEVIDYKGLSESDIEEVVYHEIVGHAFWHWAKKWRHEEWEAFNKLANQTPAVNDYVAEYYQNKSECRTDTIYENEQHSAITELIKHGSSYYTITGKNGAIATEEQIKALKKSWEELHY